MESQQLVILSRQPSKDGGLSPIGTRDEVVRQLAVFNTSPEKEGENDVLYGPGIRIELSPGDPVTQMLLTMVEEEIAWQVILRLAKGLEWKLLDPISGRELSPG